MTVIMCIGGMRSAKSFDAMHIIRGFKEDGLKTILFQPEKNTRDLIDGAPVWRSSNGNFEKTYAPALKYTTAEEVLKLADKFDVFGFEEHHWYPEDYVSLVEKLDSLGKIVVDVGLDYYHNGKPVLQFEALSKFKNVACREGVGAYCYLDIALGKRTLAKRTQMLINGEPPTYDSPTNVAEDSSDRFGGEKRQAVYTYQPVSIKNWQVLPPKDFSLMEEYKKYYLEVKELA